MSFGGLGLEERQRLVFQAFVFLIIEEFVLLKNYENDLYSKYLSLINIGTFFPIIHSAPKSYIHMSKLSYLNSHQANQAATLLAIKQPSLPTEQKQPFTEKRIADPSSSTPTEKRYPIPSFFEYRAKPKEYDSL